MEKDKDIQVSVVLPVYNEKEAIRQSVVEIRDVMEKLPYNYEIIIVDDGSTDESIEEIKDLQVLVVRHPYNRGGGIARVTGMMHAKGNIIVQSDVDGTYPASSIGEMIELMKTSDLVIGSRRIESQEHLHLLRVLMKWFIRKIAELLVNQKIPDLNSGLRIYRRDIALRYQYLYPSGHSIMSTMTIAFLMEGFRVKFVPVEYRKRIGKTSFHIWKDTYNYLQVTISTVAFFNPLRILMPIFLILVMFAVIFTVRDVFRLGLGPLTLLLWITSFLVILLAIISEQIVRVARYIAYAIHSKSSAENKS